MALGADARATFLAIVKGDASQAVTEFKRMGDTIDRTTHGAGSNVGRFRTLANNAMGEIRANAGVLAAAGGGALLAFGVHAVNAFTDAAKAAIDLSKATGLSTEEASRWIAVGDDYGVTAENLQTALGRIGKDLDSDKWAEYGIATRDASGQARDANEIFLDVLDVLNRTDEAARTNVGAELLGRGWQGIAPILGQTRDAYKEMLATVEDGQVITDGEAKRAEKMRLAQDKLNDAIGEFTLAIGESAAGLAPLIEGLAKLAEYSRYAIPDYSQQELGNDLREITRAAIESGDALGYFAENAPHLLKAAPGLIADVRREMAELGETAQEMSPSAYDAAEQIREMGDASDDAVTSLEDLAAMLGELDRQNAALDIADSFDEIEAKAKEAWIKTAEGAEDATRAQRDYERSLNDTAAEVADYLASIEGIPPQAITEVVAMIDAGKLHEAQLAIWNLTRPRDVVITPSVKAPKDWGSTNVGKAEAYDGGRSGAAGITVNLVVGEETVQAITVQQENMARGNR